MTLIVDANSNAVSLRFKYDGFSRIVDNVTIEADHGTLIGFELRKSGKWSHQIKRYKLDGISEIQVINTVTRSGPVLARP